MHGERLQRQPLLLGLFDDSVSDPVEGRPRHRRIRIVPGRQQIPGITGAGLERDHDVEGLSAQVDIVRLRSLHALLRDRPDGVFEIDFIPNRVL